MAQSSAVFHQVRRGGRSTDKKQPDTLRDSEPLEKRQHALKLVGNQGDLTDASLLQESTASEGIKGTLHQNRLD